MQPYKVMKILSPKAATLMITWFEEIPFRAGIIHAIKKQKQTVNFALYRDLFLSIVFVIKIFLSHFFFAKSVNFVVLHLLSVRLFLSLSLSIFISIRWTMARATTHFQYNLRATTLTNFWHT